MRAYVAATGAVITVHVALGIIWSPYLRLLADCGALLSHGNDIADLPRQALLGAIIVGGMWLAVANGLVAVYRNRD